MGVVDQLELVGLVALAAALGGLLGYERETRDKPAGLRTHMLVAAVAAAVMLVGEAIIDATSDGTSSADPNRALHAVITGVGFIGAGAILRRSGRGVHGLTTAASLFAAAGIGVAVGARLPIVGIGIAVIAIATLRGGGWIERRWVEERDEAFARDPEREGASMEPQGATPASGTLIEVEGALRAKGYVGQFRAADEGRVECLTCHQLAPASEISVHGALHRLEGTSDPADMLAVAAVACPRCGAQGTLVMHYGPLAPPTDAAVLDALSTPGA